MVNPTGYTALDLIGFTDKDAYSSSANYVKNDLVHYGGNIWRCLIDDTSGIAPAEGVNWTLFIGEPTNLVERIIAPVETDPATSAWAVGRQIIFNDNLYEVIAAITAGDALVAYEDDPTNANIKLADPVETQLLNEESTRAAADLALRNTMTNRNLLDNAWFTVNQRGQSSYGDSSGYTCDRWRNVIAGRGSVDISGDGLTITANDSTQGPFVRQDTELKISDFIGKTLTLSFKLLDGSIYSESATITGNELENIAIISVNHESIRALLFVNSSGLLFVNIRKDASEELAYTIRAIKLEIGSISTLAMDTAPNYTEELLKCQRYFYRIGGKTATSYRHWFDCVASASSNTNRADCILRLPVPMRADPSLSTENISSLQIYVQGSGYQTLSNLTRANVLHDALGQAMALQIRFTISNNVLVSGSAYPVGEIDSNTNIISLSFSADL